MEPEIVARMRAGLTDAMKARNRTAVRALRTALAAIANAEAPATEVAPTPVHGRPNEYAPLVLSVVDIEHIVQAEIDDRHDTIARIAPHGRADEAAELRAEIQVLERYLL